MELNSGSYRESGMTDESVEAAAQVHKALLRNTHVYKAGKDLTTVCAGVFFLGSFANHSCYGNADVYYCHEFMVIEARRDIRKGEEILHDYGAPTIGFDKDAPPSADRAKYLKEHWGIQCDQSESCQHCLVPV